MVHFPIFQKNKSSKNNNPQSSLSDQLLQVSEWYSTAESLLLKDHNFTEASKYLKLAAFTFNNHHQSQALLGFCYEFSLGLAQDCKSAVNLYMSAAVQGNGLACARLSFLRRYGRPGVKIDRVEAEEWIKKTNQLDNPLEWLLKAADVYHLPSACYALGVCFHDGIGTTKTPERAVAYYKQAVSAGEPRGEGILGYCYGEGFGLQKDEFMAFCLYLKAARKGESVSMYNLAHCYEEGIGTEKNIEEATKWYIKSAQAGNCYAQNSLGYMYEEGLGVDRSEEMAVNFYKLAAEQGYPWSQCNLGYCLQNGIGTEKNELMGAYWYQKAANQNHSRAQHNLGHAYQYGIGVPKDEILAVEWYKRSAAAGNSFALHSLGYCYQYGIGCAVDEYISTQLYRESANLGHAPAQLSLGCSYRNGVGVPVNEKEAFRWIRQSALGGNDLAQNTLGHLYEDGIGTIKNIEKAVYWYTISARQGNVWALTNLGILYIEGVDISKNIPEAFRLLKLAAEQDHPRAQVRLGDLYFKGNGIQENKENAFYWYSRASNNGSVSGMAMLGQCYEYGYGCIQELSRAMEWYERAASWGDQSSAEKLLKLSNNAGRMLNDINGHGFVAPAAYFAGKIPEFHKSHNSSSDDEEPNKSSTTSSQPTTQTAYTIISTKQHQQPTNDKRLHRLESNNKSDIIIHQDIVIHKQEDSNVETDQARRQRIKALALKRIQEQQQQSSSSSGSDEESSNDESSNDDNPSFSHPLKRTLLKPTFVSKTKRDTVITKQDILEKQQQLKNEKLQEQFQRKTEAHNMVAEELRREIEEAKMQEKFDVDDTDGINDDEEHQAWILRELSRIKRDRMLQQQRQLEAAEKLKRQNMTDLELQQQLEHEASLVEKPKMKFMQKYYHKGAFYVDDKKVSDALNSRNFTAPTLEDRFDKKLMPAVMQVRNFGRASQSKYTHLMDQDTTVKDAGWNQSKKHVESTDGKKQDFQKPITKKQKIL